MSRYIDADAITEKKWQAESEACFYALEDVVSVTDIDDAPSIDIVRCKECKWGGVVRNHSIGFCENQCGVRSAITESSYCSYGEREGE